MLSYFYIIFFAPFITVFLHLLHTFYPPFFYIPYVYLPLSFLALRKL